MSSRSAPAAANKEEGFARPKALLSRQPSQAFSTIADLLSDATVSVLLLIAGCSLLLCAALLSSRALGFRRVAPTLAASFCLGNAMLLLPIHVLGFSGHLQKTSVVAATLATAALALVAAAWRLGGAELRSFLGLPLAALTSLKSPLARGSLLIVAGVLLHAIYGALRLPSDGWDAIWYHDTIVGGTLQAGGYSVIPLPLGLVQQANGFPRNGEMVGLWLVSLADRRVIELPNACALAGLIAAAHIVAERFARPRQLALGLACASCLVPGALLQLRSTYVDVYAAAAGLTAIAFLTAAPLRPREALVGGFALAIFAGAKSSALFVVPFALALLLLRALRGGRQLRLAACVASALVLLSFAGVYLRNALLFANPLYPFAFHLPRLGIDLPGVTAQLDVNATTRDLVESIFLPAPPGRDFADIRRGGFGLAFAWVLLPLALSGAVLAARVLARRAKGRRAIVEKLRARWLLLTLGLIAPATVLSPALWSARYHLVAIAISAAPAAYALARLPRWAATVALSFANLLMGIAIVRFDPPLGARSDWGMDAATAELRERELGPGQIVAFGPGVAFPSELYNDRFDNQLAFIADDTPRAIEKRLASAPPTWVVAAPDEPLYRYVGERSDQWELIGLASRNAPTYAFRRKQTR